MRTVSIVLACTVLSFSAGPSPSFARGCRQLLESDVKITSMRVYADILANAARNGWDYRADGSVLWAESYDGGLNVAELWEAQTDIARNVSTSLAQTYGIIFQADANLHVDNPPDDWAAYSCTLSFYAYRVDVDAESRSSQRSSTLWRRQGGLWELALSTSGDARQKCLRSISTRRSMRH